MADGIIQKERAGKSGMRSPPERDLLLWISFCVYNFAKSSRDYFQSKKRVRASPKREMTSAARATINAVVEREL